MFIQATLIAGRTLQQGVSVNEGKSTDTYKELTSTLDINTDDLDRLGIGDGAPVRLVSEYGRVTLRCKARQPEDLPDGLVFLPYGPAASLLMGGETQGTGMPRSKGIDVQVIPIPEDEREGGAAVEPADS